MRILPLLALASVFAAASVAHADTYTTFTLNDTYNAPTNTGGTVDGTLVYDNTTSTFYSVDVTPEGFPDADGVNGQAMTLQGQFANPTNGSYAVEYGNASGAGGYFNFGTTDFANVSSVDLCTLSSDPAHCTVSNFGNTGFGYDAVSGTLTNTSPTTPVSATPEPSSMALLGTGLLAAAGMVRRRRLA